MDHLGIIKRAWQITWRYRVLWIFGFLLALSSGGGGGGSGNAFARGGGNGLNPPSFPSTPDVTRFPFADYAGLLILCCCLLMALVVALAIVRLVAQAGLYRLVDGIEATGEQPGWKAGFRLGWSTRTVRLFLLELLVGIPFALMAVVLLALGLSPLLLLRADANALKAMAVVLTVILEIGMVILILAASAVFDLLGQFWKREVVLGDRSVGQALASGYNLARRHLRDAGIMWLIMLGIGLLSAVVMLPAVLALLVVAVAAGGGLGYLIYAASQSVVLAVIAGLPLGLIILIVPAAFLQGVYMVFESSTWTLAYRNLVSRPG